MTDYRIGFIMEQSLGHVTYTRNLQANVTRMPDVDSLWGLVHYAPTGIGAYLPGYRSNWTVRAGIGARSHLRTFASHGRLDALFFHTQVPAMFAIDWLHRLPSVVSLDATPIQYDALGASYGHTRGPQMVEHAKLHLSRVCFNSARALVSWSEWTRQSLIKDYGIDGNNITVVPPGVNIDEWRRPAPATAQPDKPMKILFVGGDLARKGGNALIDAVRQLRANGYAVELHLVTRATVPAEPGLHVYNSMEPNSPALRALYHTSDVFCLPTLGDCLPMVLAEAGAAGLPLVSTTVGAIPELVRTNDTGLLVRPGNGAELYSALRVMLDNPDARLRWGNNAANLVARQHDARRNAAYVLDLLRCAADTVVTKPQVVS